ncbi:MAG: glycosyltransferase family 9 protein, partial [Planctomycetota bacterium]|nr:glycosyltransferase family 9 protein [Planctomycetota bacterium]
REKTERILVIKLWAIGEVVLATPVFEALRQKYPDAQIDLLVGKTALAVVEHNPHLSSVIPIDESIFLRLRLREIIRLARRLQPAKYDTAILLHKVFIYGVFARLCGIRRRLGLSRGFEGFALTDRIPQATHHVHRVEEYLSVLGPLGIQTSLRPTTIFLRPKAHESANQLLSKETLQDPPPPTISLLPTGGANDAAGQLGTNFLTKRWPIPSYLELADRLSQQGARVLILGGPAEQRLRPSFESLDSPNLHIWIGETDLETTMGLLHASDLVVSNDSGPMHIASALGIPVLAAFGPTYTQVARPLSPGSRVLTGSTPCTCHVREDVFPNIVPTCKQDQICLKSVTVDQMIEAATEMLTEAKSTRP